MRNAFINTLMDCAANDERIALLMAEVGYSVVEPFEKAYSDRFYNTGIAEQNLITTAAGMAMAGMRPVAYSMSCFLPSRAYEFIKISVCYQNLPVVIVGVGTGISYGELGATHHAAEESALMRSLPNMTVIFPADKSELGSALRFALKHDGPTYISFPKAPSPNLPEHDFTAGKSVKYTDGKDGVIFAAGTMAETALKVVELLEKQGIKLGVYGLHTVKPLDAEAIREASKSGNVFVIDEHFPSVGDDISREILSLGINLKLYQEFVLPDKFCESVGSYSELLYRYGLTAEQITESIAKEYK